MNKGKVRYKLLIHLNQQSNVGLPRLSHRVAATTIWKLQFPLLGSPPYGIVLFVAALLLGSGLPEGSVTLPTNVAVSIFTIQNFLCRAGVATHTDVFLRHITGRASVPSCFNGL